MSREEIHHRHHSNIYVEYISIYTVKQKHITIREDQAEWLNLKQHHPNLSSFAQQQLDDHIAKRSD
jgi:hypothetical protein